MSKRDLELDALRGIFIFIITADHMQGIIVYFTWQTFGFASALPGFLFLSGFLVAKVYGGLMLRRGVLSGLRKMALRVWKIYLWHAASVLVVVGGTMALAWVGLGIEHRMATLQSLAGLLMLEHLNPYFNILPLYLFFLAFAALLLLLFSRYPLLIAVTGVLIWALAPVVPSVLHPWGSTALLQPVSWQVVFTLGLALGLFQVQGGHFRSPPWLTMIAAGLALLFFALRWHILEFEDVGLDPGLFERDALGLGRLLNILCLIVLITWAWPRLKPWLERRRLLVMVGQASLAAFSLQIMIVYYLGMIRRGLASYTRPDFQDLLRFDVDWPSVWYLLIFDGLSVSLVAFSTYAVFWTSRRRLVPNPSRRQATGSATRS
jgi:hypothetical protein